MHRPTNVQTNSSPLYIYGCYELLPRLLIEGLGYATSEIIIILTCDDTPDYRHTMYDIGV